MIIVHISSGYLHGGAAIACNRLVEAQRSVGIDARIITQEPGKFPGYVSSTTRSFLKQKINFVHHAWEKFVFLFYEASGAVRFLFSIGNSGEKVRSNQILKEADIIHFHWFNAGFISLKEFGRILKLGKPVVWTLHDMWAFTGGCHYAGDCNNYQNGCGNCCYLKRPANKDLSSKIFKKKKQIYSLGNLQFITPSEWMAGCARQSGLLKNMPVHVIPNAISEIKFEAEKDRIRGELGLPINKKLILFGAFNMNHTRKGSKYLVEALAELIIKDDCELLVFGKSSDRLPGISLKTHFMGYSSDEEYIRKIYSCADVYVNPSIEDNLPNTVLESFSAGTPVVAFNMGGMPDMIDHKQNGYLAEYKNPGQLAEGIRWCLENNNEGQLSKNATCKISDNFSYPVIGRKFKTYYSSILNAKS
jgi:glycosyltransferase involved in cell wall biosynthesis